MPTSDTMPLFTSAPRGVMARVRAALAGSLLLVLLAASASAQGSVVVVGGGSEAPGAYAWFVDHAPNRTVVVLDYEDAPNTSIVPRLIEEGAAATYLAVTSRDQANDPANRDAVLAADGVFLPGGDQWRYINRWKGTLVEEALQAVFDRGGVLGGTSAGAAVLSEIVFDARRGSIDSREVLLVPTSRDISLTDDFLDVLPGVLADTHFDERGRLGRLLAMLASYHQASGRWVTGVGLAYGTALAVGPDGVGTVFGGGPVTFLYPTERTRARVEPDQPLSLSNVRFLQLTDGSQVEVATGLVVEAPPTAEPFTPVPFRAPPFRAVLDGSADADAWLASGGSVSAFRAALSPSALVCVVSGPGAPIAATVVGAFTDAGQPVTLVGLDAASQDDAALAATARQCDAEVWVANDLRVLADVAAPTTAVGAALRDQLDGGAPALFLGSDARAVGQAGVTNAESRCDTSFQGSLILTPGLSLMDGLFVMPIGFETTTCHWENQIDGLMWGVAKTGASFGVLLADGSTLTFDGDAATMRGAVPALVLDARPVETVAYPVRRNNAALIEGEIHVVADGGTFDFFSAPTASEPTPDASPGRGLLVYPNPTAGPVSVVLDAPTGGQAEATVFDVLGREVASSRLGGLVGNDARVGLDLSGLQPGVYLVRVRVGGVVRHGQVTVR